MQHCWLRTLHKSKEKERTTELIVANKEHFKKEERENVTNELSIAKRQAEE
jgi:hypothetical protein